MRVEFSHHSCDRIKRRRISRKRVLETISNPDEVENSFRGRKLRKKRFGDIGYWK